MSNLIDLFPFREPKDMTDAELVEEHKQAILDGDVFVSHLMGEEQCLRCRERAKRARHLPGLWGDVEHD